MVVGGDDVPVVVYAVVQCARVANGSGHIVADEIVRGAVIGLEIDVVGHCVPGVRITACPTQIGID